MYDTTAYGKKSKDGQFEKLTVKRGECGPDGVEFDVKYCGICHTDVHFANDDFGRTKWPVVPGHELAGVVVKVGANVKNIKVGDKVGVGCIVDSCMDCVWCNEGDENACVNGMTMTYNSDIKHGHELATDTGYSFGGYSTRYTVHQRYAVRIPDSYPLEAAGPVFCAGITMYTPLKTWGALSGGKRVGIVGIGGLGQMGIRLAKAMGNEVTAISTSASKEKAAKAIGASRFIVSTDEKAMEEAAGSLDLILNTVSANHQVSTYMPLLARKGAIVQLGAVSEPHVVSQLPLMSRKILTGSAIGGMPDTQAVIDFCHEKGIKPEIELVTADKLADVYELLNKKNDSIKRYVLDLEKSEGKL